jgi:hypothetical protein
MSSTVQLFTICLTKVEKSTKNQGILSNITPLSKDIQPQPQLTLSFSVTKVSTTPL